MQAPNVALPQLGEWHSHQELFHTYFGYWALLVFPNPLTELLAFDKDYAVVRAAHQAFRRQDAQTLLSFFATEQEDDIVLIAGLQGGSDATTTHSMDANHLAYAFAEPTGQDPLTQRRLRIS
jgi:hypothetical protein